MSANPAVSALESLRERLNRSASAIRPIDQTIGRCRVADRAFYVLGWLLLVLSLSVLALLMWNLASAGLSRINWQFLTSFPSRNAARAGILSPWVGSLLVMLVTASTAIPLGIGAGIFLEEYAKKNKFTTIIEVNIANLAGVPSIIYGLMALGLLVYTFELGQSILTGGITLGFLILPIVIVATREALRAIPQAIREAAYALGASRWQVIRQHLLPYSLGGISTGVIIALSRAIGETAPLITIGALTFIAYLPPAPFQERAWLFAENANIVIAADVPIESAPIDWDLSVSKSEDRPRVLPGSFSSGTILLQVRPREERDNPDAQRPVVERTVAIDLSPAGAESTLRGFAAALNSVEGVDAEIDVGGRLTLRSEDDQEFRFVRDPTGVLHALGIPPGGGRHGPLAWLNSGFTVLPIQMFNWVSRPGTDFMANAAAAGVILMIATLGMNAVAIVLRYRLRKRIKW